MSKTIIIVLIVVFVFPSALVFAQNSPELTPKPHEIVNGVGTWGSIALLVGSIPMMASNSYLLLSAMGIVCSCDSIHFRVYRYFGL